MHSAFHPAFDQWRTTSHAHRLRGKALAPKRNRPERSEHPTGPLRNTACFWCARSFASVHLTGGGRFLFEIFGDSDKLEWLGVFVK